MSRIAGIVNTGQAVSAWLHLALSVVAQQDSDPTWIQKTISIGNSHVGWTGRRNNFFIQQDNVTLLLDGYIYNDHDLIKQNSEDNKETYLINLYHRLGFSGMLLRLNGDFVIVLHDRILEKLFIARDRFGVKPLYYAAYKNCFCFASRCVSLFALGIPAQPDPSFIGRFAGTHYRYIDNQRDRSSYLNIHQLPAAHYICIKTGNSFDPSSFVVKSWWELKDRPDFELADERESVLAEEYRDLLLDAVNIRLMKAENPAFTLSGGLDSSSVLASAVQNTNKKFHAFSTVYKDKTYDESNEIQSMLDSKVEKWHPIQIDDDPDVFGLVNRMIALHDEPVGTATWLSHFLLCENVAQKGFASLFGGLGGDELNAGEYEYFFLHFADLKKSGRDDLYHHEVKKWSEYHDHPIFKKDPEVAARGLERLTDLGNSGHCLPDQSRMFRYAQALNSDFFNTTFQPRMDHPFLSYLKNRTYQDLYFETAPCCLRAEDRQATAFGLDHFLPFFDYRLVEFMFRVPGTLKIRDGVTKILLRAAMKNILPTETRMRIKKTGWNAPAHQWFSGKKLEWIKDMIHSTSFKERGIYNPVQLDKIFAEHETIIINGEQRENHMMFIWQLINLELWLNQLKNYEARTP